MNTLARIRRLENLELGNDKRWRGHLSVPTQCNPLVRQFFEAANQRSVFLEEIAQRSGLNRSTMDGWRRTGNPNLISFVAALNVLDLDLKIVPRKS